MNESGCSDEGVSFGMWIGDMQGRTAHCYCGIHRQDSIGKRWQNLSMEPMAKKRALKGIAALNE